MTAGHISYGIRHRHDGQAEGEGYAQKSNAHVWKRGGEHRAAATPEDQPKSSNELRRKLSGQVHVRLLSFVVSFGMAVSKNAIPWGKYQKCTLR